MPHLTVYYPGTEGRDGTKDALACLAASFGYYTVHYPDAPEEERRGSIRTLLAAIVSGEIALVLLPDEERDEAIADLRQHATPTNGFRQIAEALKEAAEREAE